MSLDWRLNRGFPMGGGGFRGTGNVLKGWDSNAAREADFESGAK